MPAIANAKTVRMLRTTPRISMPHQLCRVGELIPVRRELPQRIALMRRLPVVIGQPPTKFRTPELVALQHTRCRFTLFLRGHKM